MPLFIKITITHYQNNLRIVYGVFYTNVVTPLLCIQNRLLYFILTFQDIFVNFAKNLNIIDIIHVLIALLIMVLKISNKHFHLHLLVKDEEINPHTISEK